MFKQIYPAYIGGGSNFFFYLLDVGTSNAMILYSLTKRDNKINLATFKKALVRHFIGDVLYGSVASQQEDCRHLLVRISEDGDVRSMCTYCSLVDREKHRTRYKCSLCNIPLCSQASGKRDRDCFALAHETEGVVSLLHEHSEKQQQRTILKNRRDS